MPLREDLLTPIAGDNPAGADLYYDPVFEQIKEARREDNDDNSSDPFGISSQKKADYRAVIRLAGEALAKRSKDLRLAGPLVEACVHMEGLAVLAPCIHLLRELQEQFWEHLYPLPDDGTDFEMRMITVEGAARFLSLAIRKVPLTRKGLNFDDYQEAQKVGYEKDATSDAKMEARQDAIDHGRLTAEDFDQAFAATPKSFYADAAARIEEALVAVGQLDDYGGQAYPTDAPSLSGLRQALQNLQVTAGGLLNEKRRTDPDAVVAPEPAAEEEMPAEGEEPSGEASARPARGAVRMRAPSGQIGEAGDAYAMVVESALFLLRQDSLSPVPYLVCAGLRLGETYRQDAEPAPGFAAGPPPEVRSTLRRLAGRGAWAELLREVLPALASESGRAWLDLHRYVWSAGEALEAPGLSMAAVGTMRSLLTARPELRHWTLEDDTGAANPETQRWIDSTVLQ